MMNSLMSNDLDDCISTGEPPFAIIANSYTLIKKKYAKKGAWLGLAQTQRKK